MSASQLLYYNSSYNQFVTKTEPRMDTAAIRLQRLAAGHCPIHGTDMEVVVSGPARGHSILVCSRKNCGIKGMRKAGATQVSLTPEFQHLLGPVPVLTSKKKVPKAPRPKPPAEEINEIRRHLFEVSSLLTNLSGQQDGLLYCSFCGKSQHEIGKMIAGPGVNICDECVGLCQSIFEDEGSAPF